ALKLWAYFAKRPALYHPATRLAIGILGALGRRQGRLRRLPLAEGWTRHRDLPTPESGTFQQQWRRRHT
ncbi:MAG: lactate utilization protein LutB domain-containing protein, partial [Alphaproteobacteria bacterium]